MLIKKLKERYPDLTYSEKPLKINTTHLFFYENPYYFAIPKKTLTSEEQALLQSLFQAPAPVFKNEQLTEWHTLLFTQEDVIIHPENNSFRIIQFQIQSTSLSKKILLEWQKALVSFFAQDTELIMLTEDYGILIEKIAGSLLGEDELDAIATTLESDFYIQVHFFMGLFHEKNALLRDLFAEEQRLFRQNSNQLVQTVESNCLPMIAAQLTNSLLAQEISRLFEKDETWKPLIKALWENQGNLSMTAKALFMHRNTMQYRIDKFQELTNLSLRKTDGLLFAYLSCLLFETTE
ncbi:helix-turn-helix domain-containing protein [Paenilisteria rocourtiae]|uniref:PucR-like helix-turn-helix protein n=1 Tax=Listeria rocourtiae TaxID=647910 RepID=A0A4R6ZFX8_9LIST|nr:helix-turn-helix domain-containing protein [Listeria rocourtiae]MBC1605774.1 PucR family transcriptional regulator [Listeria rocourtiae]TDR51060.1 PucR-like helix-turn-helix protein [Listeria rocourtiae]